MTPDTSMIPSLRNENAMDPREYLHIVEWNFSPSVVVHSLRVADGVAADEFERRFESETLPRLGRLKTRGGAVVAQKLLRDTTGKPPGRFEMLDAELGDLAVRTSVRKYQIIADHRS